MKTIIELNGMETVASIENGALLNLAKSLEGGETVAAPVAEEAPKKATRKKKAAEPEVVEAPQAAEPVTPVAPVTPIQAAPTPITPVQAAPMAAAPTPAQVAPAPTQLAPASVAPVAAAPAITVDQISVAGANLIQSNPGAMASVQDMLGRYGVASVIDLRPEQIDAFATELRGLGAAI